MSERGAVPCRRNRLAPVISVVLVGIGLTGCSTSVSTSSTATPAPPPPPQTVVVTATPPGGGPTAVKAGSTPLPGATPVPTRRGLILGMITHTATDVSRTQARADAADTHFTYYLHPQQVAQQDLPKYGFTTVDIASTTVPAPEGSNLGRPLARVVIRYRNDGYQVYLAQVAKHGAGGIWMITSILPQPLRIGTFTYVVSTVTQIQHQADAHNPNYAPYLDPRQSVVHTIADKGFIYPVSVVSGPAPVSTTTGHASDSFAITYMGKQYSVVVMQPGRQGAGGIWLIMSIQPR